MFLSKIYRALFYSLFALKISAQTITGLLVDSETGDVVQNCTLACNSDKAVAVSDANGYFKMKLKNNMHTVLICSHVSYEKAIVQLNELKADTFIIVTIKAKTAELADIQVTAALPRQVLSRSYSQTNIDAISIQERIASSLIDVLEEVPGITKRGEYFSPIALRGLGGKRLLMTENGNRLMGNFSGSFMGQGVNVFDLSKIEVIKGPASVKYGPGAISGIINIVNKSPFIVPGWHGNGICSYGVNNNELTTQFTLNNAGMDNAISFSARLRDADDYVGGLKRKTENTEYHDKDFRFSFANEGSHNIAYSLVSQLHLGGTWGRPLGFNGNQYMRIYNTDDDTWHTSILAEWKPESGIRKMELSVYYNQEYRCQLKDSYDAGSGKISYREEVKYNNYYSGWRFLTVVPLKQRMELNIGSDGVYYRIQSPTTLTDYFLSATINNKVSKNAGVILAGIFAEDEYKSADGRLKIRLGCRADWSRINEGEVHDTLLISGRRSNVLAWNGTAGAVYELMRGVYSSIQFARSCRMPDASEMFIVNSTTDGIVYGNPLLKPEYGYNIDVGIRGGNEWMSFDMSLYCNLLKDFISVEYWTQPGLKGINYSYFNVDKARIFGAEFSFGAKWNAFIQPDNTLLFNTMMAYTFGDKLTGLPGWLRSGVPLRNIPPTNCKLELIFRRIVNSVFSMYISSDLRLYATQYRIAPTADGGYVSPGYVLFGAAAGIERKNSNFDWSVKLRADNLTDNYYRPFESLAYAMGRNIKIMFSVKF